MKRYIITGRYGDRHTLVESESGYNLQFSTKYHRIGFRERDEVGISFVDPSGGPFISVGEVLEELHDKLPKGLKIKTIEYVEGKESEFRITPEPMTRTDKLDYKKDKAKKAADLKQLHKDHPEYFLF